LIQLDPIFYWEVRIRSLFVEIYVLNADFDLFVIKYICYHFAFILIQLINPILSSIDFLHKLTLLLTPIFAFISIISYHLDYLISTCPFLARFYVNLRCLSPHSLALFLKAKILVSQNLYSTHLLVPYDWI